MIAPQVPKNESARIRVLNRYDVLDTPQEEVFDRITRIASVVAGVPISLVSLIDEERQWFKSRVGLDAPETARGISFCGHAINTDKLFVVPDASLDARFADNPLVTGALGVRFYAGVPLLVSEDVKLGTLCVIDQQARQLSEEQFQALQDLAVLTVRELEFRKVALTDPLTGAYNRRMFEKLGAAEISRARRKAEPFCFAMLDLDYFKKVNDEFGHDSGDTVLMEVARICRETLRSEDSLFRLGGEEFGILLGNTKPDAALVVIDRLRRNIEATRIAVVGNTAAVTISAGVSAYRPGDETVDVVVRRADVALYKAKESGRNRVVVA